MKIGIIADTHDNLTNLKKAIDILNSENIKTLIHCGDLCAPFVLRELKKFNGDIHCVFGNTDDRYYTPILAKELGINFHGDIGKIEIDGRKILVNHFPEISRAFAFTGEFDAVFHGHKHKPIKEKINNTLVLSPGEVAGILGEKSLSIYDTKTNDAEIITID